MGMLLAFAPFIAYAVLQRALGMLPALAVAALISLGFTLRDLLVPERHLKLLEVGSTLLFGGLGVAAWLSAAEWPILQVRLWVDAGLLAIVLLSLAIRRPFTMAYARERVPRAYWASPRFLHFNDIITAAWAGAFVVLLGADLLMLYRPEVPLWIGVALTLAALAGAMAFTKWFAARAGREAQARAG